MSPAFVVLTDMSPAAEVALTYTARLAQLLNGRVQLLHVYMDLVLEPEIGMVAAPIQVANCQEILTEMMQRARLLPVPAEAELSIEPLTVAVSEVVQRHHPLLLAIGRLHPESVLDHLLHNHALPILQDASHPLLLVPENWTDTELPTRIVVAADDQHFWLNGASLRLEELLTALHPTTTVVHVASGDGPSEAGIGLEAVRRTGLFGAITGNSLYEVRAEAPAEGILHAAAEQQAQLIVMLARPHTLFEDLFHRSVTGQVLRHSPVPVLVLPTI